MAWKLPRQPHRVFERNPLVAVIVELRFHPVLKVPAKVADFQDKVRTTFPAFQQLQTQTVSLGPGPVHIRGGETYTFTKADESSVLSLATGSMSIESRHHQRREQLFGDVKVAVDALLAVYGPIAATRLGLRYVDVVDRERIAKALGRATSWDKLITSPFVAIPADVAELDGTLFACEVASPTERGAQTVRYGLIKDGDNGVNFRLDVDRYIETAVEPANVVPTLESFANDTFAVFMAAAGPDLVAWMQQKEERG
jgi:uncharacterized protein (TIGR04255 family)